jgi:hypothetical protein
MKIAKLIVVVGIATLFIASCGTSRKNQCPSLGAKTYKTR